MTDGLVILSAILGILACVAYLRHNKHLFYVLLTLAGAFNLEYHIASGNRLYWGLIDLMIAVWGFVQISSSKPSTNDQG